MNHVKQPDAGRAVNVNKAIAEPVAQDLNLEAVAEVVEGYYLKCCKAVHRPGSCHTLSEIRNANEHINAMLQACVSLHIAMLPAPARRSTS